MHSYPPSTPCNSPTLYWPAPARLLPTTLAASPSFANSCIKLGDTKRNHTHNTFIPPHVACRYCLLPFLVFSPAEVTLVPVNELPLSPPIFTCNLPATHQTPTAPFQRGSAYSTNLKQTPILLTFRSASCSAVLISKAVAIHPLPLTLQPLQPTSAVSPPWRCLLTLSSATKLLPLSHMFKWHWESGNRCNLRYFCYKSIYSALSRSPNRMDAPAPLSMRFCQRALSLPFTVLLPGTTSSLSEGKFTSIHKHFLLPAFSYSKINKLISHSYFLHPPPKISHTLRYCSARTEREDLLSPP